MLLAERRPLPDEVTGGLEQVFSWFLWFAAVFSVASLVATVMTLVWMRRSASSTHLIEESVLLRILIATVITSSSGVLALTLLR
ncbi:hypothetical protein [Nocardia sp. XZ_19_231]|uniref:hypothetical protein n=1 Tax=Nocardia sp. XZ_19_231 TaxID=2769252 RepID=UPI00188F82C6|nr:hypothetical protein [Nocardia sp. XZ_19_231]